MPDPTDDDDDLIARSARGDRRAFAALVERHGRAVLAVARALGARTGGADAEDVVQETFVSALASAATYRPGASSGRVRTWLFAIARNVARRSHRRDREVPAGGGDDVPLVDLGIAAGWGHEPADVALDRVASAEHLARAIASLPEPDREVLVLRDVEQLDGEATAAALGLGLAAMKSRLHRARLRLMAGLREGEGGIVANERDVGGLTCSEVLERLGDYVDGELPSSEVTRVDAHLRECTVCERFGGRYAQTVHHARERLGLPHAVDDETLARVLRTLET